MNSPAMTDRETLARLLERLHGFDSDDAADAILASDWLASVRAEAERSGMMRAAGIARGYREQWGCAGGFGGHSAGARIIAEAIEAAAPAGETADERQAAIVAEARNHAIGYWHCGEVETSEAFTGFADAIESGEWRKEPSDG